MASKLPLKIFDLKQKLTRLAIRINKSIKHKILSKSRNVLIITSQPQTYQFDNKLKNILKKTWQIYQLNLIKNKSIQNYQQIQKIYFGKQYDAIIVTPLSNRNLIGYYNIQQQQFATNLLIYNIDLMKNILAYRLAHKYLATSGILILSNSQADFAKVQNKNGIILVEQPALKNILDAQRSYLAVTIGDRDYTDLNSWSVVGLSEEFINSEHEDFVVKKYGQWAEGYNLPMPGSFALFKMKEDGKKGPFIQYL